MGNWEQNGMWNGSEVNGSGNAQNQSMNEEDRGENEGNTRERFGNKRMRRIRVKIQENQNQGGNHLFSKNFPIFLILL